MFPRNTSRRALVLCIPVLALASTARADGPCQTQRLVSPNWAEDALFGFAVATDGNAAVMTAPGGSFAGFGAGEAYVFRRAGSRWNLEQQLLPSNGDGFGYSVAVDGDVILIGAATADDHGESSGAALVFRYDGVQWFEEQRLLPPPQSDGFGFGASVALQGDLAAVGAPVRPYPQDETGFVYAFRYDGAFWTREQTLGPPDPGADQQYGNSVAIDGERLVVGAHWSNVRASGGGAAYVYRRAGNWVLEKRLLASDGQDFDEFGYNVAIEGDKIVIGAPRPWHGLGAAYVFERSGPSNWIEKQRIAPSSGGTNESFGAYVALAGTHLLVGAPQGHTVGSGRTYAYEFDGNRWVQPIQLMPQPAVGPRAYDGAALALFGDTAFIGARAADAGCEKDPDCNSGAVHVFSLSGNGCRELTPAQSRP